MEGQPPPRAFHIASNIFIVAGFWLLASAWQVLYEAQRGHRLATTGAYARIRHPQYVEFVLIMTGFLLQWPTLVTLVMYPILVQKRRKCLAQFSDQYRRYMAHVPAFIPKLGSSSTVNQT
jgi:methanethiol S-methyltransferase